MIKGSSVLVFRGLAGVLLVFYCVVALGGCASFRKKFVRQKKTKAKTEEFVPILEPVEYPDIQKTSVEIFQEHHMLARAYFQDLWTSLESRDSSGKQQLYLFKQLEMRLRGMSDVLVDGDRKTQAEGLIALVQAMQKEYDKPDALRRVDILKIDLRRLERDFRKDLKPDLVRDALKP